MEVQAVPLTEFVHDRITAHEGRPMMMDEYMATELERAGLVRINLVPRRVDRALAAGAVIVAEAGKVLDDGRGQPSSVSQAAPVSPMRTLHLSKPGGAKPRKSGT